MAAMAANVEFRSFQSRKLAGDTAPRGAVGVCSSSSTSRSGSANGSGRSKVASASANIALLAPIPSASVIVATSVKPGAPFS